MKLLWEYELLTWKKPYDSHYEGPICIHNGKIYFPTHQLISPGKDAKYLINVHQVNPQNGKAQIISFTVKKCFPPKQWAFIQHDNQLVLYCGFFLPVYGLSQNLEHLPYSDVRNIKGVGRAFFIQSSELLFFADCKKHILYCYNFQTWVQEWATQLKGEGNYTVGPPQIVQNQLVCYGQDKLNFLDLSTGAITETIKITRIDKPYPPLILNSDFILGYTNWTTGGVLKYSPKSQKVIWRYSKKFQGPATYLNLIYRYPIVVWVKGETELIGINVETGEEIWSLPTSPWLYTRIDLEDNILIFGTASRDGYIQAVNIENGYQVWSVFLKNGCAFFDYYNSSLVVGDFDKFIRRIDLLSGKEIDSIRIDAEVIGDLRVYGDQLFTVIWGTENKSPRLVCVDLE
jgi:outer membrane protein assembly factor BamB